MENLSVILKQRRKELGLTLAQVAERMGVAEATVQRWESGNIKSIRYEKIDKLADILKVKPTSLMGWDDSFFEALRLSETKSALSSMVEKLPSLPSGKRLEFLFDKTDSDPMVIAFNLDIDQIYLTRWMESSQLPPRPVIDKILGVFQMKATELLNSKEMIAYSEDAKEHPAPVSEFSQSSSYKITPDEFRIIVAYRLATPRDRKSIDLIVEDYAPSSTTEPKIG